MASDPAARHVPTYEASSATPREPPHSALEISRAYETRAYPFRPLRSFAGLPQSPFDPSLGSGFERDLWRWLPVPNCRVGVTTNPGCWASGQRVRLLSVELFVEFAGTART